ncbi:MAG TPA: adenylate cyclase regulatory domain-containing protein [Mycobacterium sp.]|nr:adenylate cyclase regulatory domain-containing protein [Mycobacterium sp.]
MVDPVRGSANFVARVVELGSAGVTELARIGGNSLLAALLALLGGRTDQEKVDEPDEASPVEVITSGLLAGEGRYTRLEVAERVGVPLDEARRLWRALGFPEVDDEQRVFTSADVAALADAVALVAADIVDENGLVELARPLGNLMSRLAAAQTTFISEVLGARIALGHNVDDPELADELAAQALATTQELLPILERTTLYTWRRHLAAEVERALFPDGSAVEHLVESRPAVVGFIDMTGYTRLSRNVDLDELAMVLDRFESTVLDTVVAHGGRVIKNLGDEILFVIDDPVSAAEATLELLDAFTAEEHLPQVHAGLAFGPVLYRGGDVYGPVVNIAARLANLARKGTIRIDQALATELADAGQFNLSLRPPRTVRGYLQLPSYRLRWARKN